MSFWKGPVTREAHNVGLSEISKRSWREQSSDILFATPRRPIHGKELNDVDVVVKDTSIARAVVPAQVQLVRIKLNFPSLPDVFTDARKKYSRSDDHEPGGL
jgi:hypothetical protein